MKHRFFGFFVLALFTLAMAAFFQKYGPLHTFLGERINTAYHAFFGNTTPSTEPPPSLPTNHPNPLSETLSHKPNTLSAQILSYAPLSPEQVMILNRGERDQVTLGTIAVDTSNHLIGHVVRVFETTSVLLLITSPDSVVDIRIGKEAYRAILSGYFEGLRAKRGLWLTHGEFISGHVEVLLGDTVTTSGLDRYYPGNLIVGTVQKLGYDEVGLFKEALILPSIDFTKLESVTLLPAKNK